jgi:hypothetical protein
MTAPRPVGPGNAREVLTVEQADALGERVREEITESLDFESILCGWCERDSRADDLRDLDRWLRALHRAHEGLSAHQPGPYPFRCACFRWMHPCPDAHRYTDAAADASDALRDLAALYGVEVPA